MDTNKIREAASDISWADILKSEDFSIDKLWKLTASQFFKNKQISQTQYNEMKKSYYAGFIECFKVMTDYAGDLEEDEACQLFSKIAEESNKFVDTQLKEFMQ